MITVSPTDHHEQFVTRFHAQSLTRLTRNDNLILC